jgi:phosphohistidine phosphatase
MPSPKPRVVLCLLRHGDAGQHLLLPRRDALRPLTGKGRKQSRRAGKALARLDLSPTACLSSRLVRAVETAKEALCAADSDVPSAATPSLAPDAEPDAVLADVAKALPDGGVVWLVGHDPHLSRLASRLVGAEEGGVALGKGSVAIFESARGKPEPGACRLVALLSAEALKPKKAKKRS